MDPLIERKEKNLFTDEQIVKRKTSRGKKKKYIESSEICEWTCNDSGELISQIT